MNKFVAAALAAMLLCAPAQAANDTIAKVRADMATAAAKQSQVDSQQNARLDALERDVAALKAAGATPTPPIASAPTPPARTYAPGVDKAGLRAVADLEFSPPGPATPPTKVPGRDPWPACVTPNRPAPNQLTIDPTACGRVVLQGWKLLGWDIFTAGKGNVDLLDNDWTPKAGSQSYMLGVGNFDGMWNGAPVVTVARNRIDGTGQAINGAFAILGSGSLTLNASTVKNFGPQLINTVGEHNDGRTRNLTITGNVLGPFGENARNGVAADPAKYWNGPTDYNDSTKPGGAHGEPFKINFGGRVVVSGNLIDISGSSGQRGTGFTSLGSFQGFEGAVVGELTGNIFRWNRPGQTWSTGIVPRAPPLALYFNSGPASASWGSYSYSVTVTGNAIQKGTSTWIGRDDTAGASPAPVLTKSGNYDYDTGALVP